MLGECPEAEWVQSIGQSVLSKEPQGLVGSNLSVDLASGKDGQLKYQVKGNRQPRDCGHHQQQR